MTEREKVGMNGHVQTDVLKLTAPEAIFNNWLVKAPPGTDRFQYALEQYTNKVASLSRREGEQMRSVIEHKKSGKSFGQLREEARATIRETTPR